MQRNKRILIVSDSPYIQTGFALVARNIAGFLHETGEWDVHYLGWFHKYEAKKNYNISYPVYTTRIAETGTYTLAHKMQSNEHVDRGDAYGQATFGKIVTLVQPDIVLTIGDCWMYSHICDSPERGNFKLVTYVPIDGSPYPSLIKMDGGGSIDAKSSFLNPDVTVAYCKYGQAEINRICGKNKCTDYIYHGVDTKLFRPLGSQFKIEHKNKLHGLDPNTFLFGTVSRNQPRKGHNLTIRALKIMKDRYKPNRNIKLYLHCALDDPTGWDIIELCKYYKMENDIVVNPSLKVGMGVSDEMINMYYNTMDAHVLASIGEGFGLGYLEAMSCGIPNVATNVSAHPEFCAPGSLLVNIPEDNMIDEVKTNIRRGFVPPSKLADTMWKIYSDSKLRDRLGLAGREKALELDWSIINNQWYNLLTNIEIKADTKTDIDSPKINLNIEEL